VRRNFTMANLLISEVLNNTGKKRGKAEKQKYLKENYSVALITVLKGAWDPIVEWNLPEGEPPFKKSKEPLGMAPSTIQLEQRRLPYLVKGHPKAKGLPQTKIEKMFIDMLESVHPDEADILIAMKDKAFTGKFGGVTKKMVAEVWPDLFSDMVLDESVVDKAI
jgi:hypothetical protein